MLGLLLYVKRFLAVKTAASIDRVMGPAFAVTFSELFNLATERKISPCRFHGDVSHNTRSLVTLNKGRCHVIDHVTCRNCISMDTVSLLSCCSYHVAYM